MSEIDEKEEFGLRLLASTTLSFVSPISLFPES
jgi:hypothetical protein